MQTCYQPGKITRTLKVDANNTVFKWKKVTLDVRQIWCWNASVYVNIYFPVRWHTLQKKWFLTPNLISYSYWNNDIICSKFSKVITDILKFCFMKTYNNILFQEVRYKKQCGKISCNVHFWYFLSYLCNSDTQSCLKCPWNLKVFVKISLLKIGKGWK